MIGDIVGGAVGGGIVALFGLTKQGSVVTIPVKRYAMESYPEHEVVLATVGAAAQRIPCGSELFHPVVAMIVYNLSAVNTAYIRLDTDATVVNGIPVYPRDYAFIPVAPKAFLSVIADGAGTDVRVVLLEDTT